MSNYYNYISYHILIVLSVIILPKHTTCQSFPESKWNTKKGNSFGFYAAETGRPFRVTSIVEYPYLTLRENGEQLYKGNDRFEGYCKEFLDVLADTVGFKYELHLVKDSRFGQFDDFNLRWNGMIGEILEGDADLAVSSMTVTRQRLSVVDFSVAFSDFRIAVLMKKEAKQDKPPDQENVTSPFNFLKPLKPSLWILFILTMIATISYYFMIEWFVSSRPKKVMECYWGVVEFLFRRETRRTTRNDEGGETSEDNELSPQAAAVPISIYKPNSKAGMIIQISMLIFLTIITSSYISKSSSFNYSRHLKERSAYKSQIKSVKMPKSLDDLWYQNKVKIFSAIPGSTASYLQMSQNPIHRSIHAQIIAERLGVETTLEGIERLRKENGAKYAFTMEEIGAKYIAAQFCDLQVLPKVYGPKKSFAVAIQLNSTYLQLINQGILHLRETGILEDLENKFRNCQHPNSNLLGSKSKKTAKKMPKIIDLNLNNTSGIFIFLLTSYFISVGLGFIEYYIKMRNLKNNKERQVEIGAVEEAPEEFVEIELTQPSTSATSSV